MRPPKEFEGRHFHWVKAPLLAPNGEPMRWDGGAWWIFGQSRSVKVTQAEAMGWVWLGVAEPPGGER